MSSVFCFFFNSLPPPQDLHNSCSFIFLSSSDSHCLTREQKPCYWSFCFHPFLFRSAENILHWDKFPDFLQSTKTRHCDVESSTEQPFPFNNTSNYLDPHHSADASLPLKKRVPVNSLASCNYIWSTHFIQPTFSSEI